MDTIYKILTSKVNSECILGIQSRDNNIEILDIFTTMNSKKNLKASVSLNYLVLHGFFTNQTKLPQINLDYFPLLENENEPIDIIIAEINLLFYVLTHTCIISYMLKEYQSGFKKYLYKSGYGNGAWWFSWYIYEMFVIIPNLIIYSVCMKMFSPLMHPVDETVIALFCWHYMNVHFVFCMVITSLFHSSRTVALTTAIQIWFFPYIIYRLLQDRYLFCHTFWHCIIHCLHPNIAMNVMFKIFIEHNRYSYDLLQTFEWSSNQSSIPILWYDIIIIFIMEIAILLIILWISEETYIDFFDWIRNKPNIIENQRHDYSKCSLLQKLNTKKDQLSRSYGEERICLNTVTTLVKVSYKPNGNEERNSLKNISLVIDNGEKIAIVSDNNSNETLLEIISREIKQTAGEVTPATYGINTGFLFSTNFCSDDFTVAEHIKFMLYLRTGVYPQTGEAEIETFHLNTFKKCLPPSLTENEKRILALAMALAGNPNDVIIFNPTNQITDCQTKKIIWKILKKSLPERSSLLFTTSDYNEAESIADKIIFLANAQIFFSGSMQKFRRRLQPMYNINIEKSTATIDEIRSVVDEYLSIVGIKYQQNFPSSVTDGYIETLSNKKIIIHLSSDSPTWLVKRFLTTLENVGVKQYTINVKHIDEKIKKQDISSRVRFAPISGCLPVVGLESGLKKSLRRFSAIFTKGIVKEISGYESIKKLTVLSFIAFMMMEYILFHRYFHYYQEAAKRNFGNYLTSLLIISQHRTIEKPKIVTNLQYLNNSNITSNLEQTHGKFIALNETEEDSIKHFLNNNSNYLNLDIGIFRNNSEFDLIYNKFKSKSLTEIICDFIQVITLGNSTPTDKTIISIKNFKILNEAGGYHRVIVPFILTCFSILFIKTPDREIKFDYKQIKSTGTSYILYWTTIFLKDLFILAILFSMTYSLGYAWTAVYQEYPIIDYQFQRISIIFTIAVLVIICQAYFIVSVTNYPRSVSITINFILSYILLTYHFDTIWNNFNSKNVLIVISIIFPTFGATIEIEKATTIDQNTTDSDKTYELLISIVPIFTYLLLLPMAEYLNNFQYHLRSFNRWINSKKDGNDDDTNTSFSSTAKYAKRATSSSTNIRRHVASFVSSDTCYVLIAQNVRQFFKPETNPSSIHEIDSNSLYVKPGDVVGIFGRPGSGTRPFLDTLMGECNSADGDAFILGKSLEENKKDYIKTIGCNYHYYQLSENLTGHEMILLFAQLRGIKQWFLKRHVNYLIKCMGLEYRNKSISKYSKLNRRKLRILLAFTGKPALVILENPFQNMNAKDSAAVAHLIKVSAAANQSIIFTHTNVDHYKYLCSRIGIMSDGYFTFYGKREKFQACCQSSYTCTVFFKQSNLFDIKQNEIDQLTNAIKTLDKTRLQFIEPNRIRFHSASKVPCLEYFKQIEQITNKFAFIKNFTLSQASVHEEFEFLTTFKNLAKTILSSTNVSKDSISPKLSNTLLNNTFSSNSENLNKIS